MVNENTGKIYQPTAHYNRKMLRNMLRHTIVAKYGYHNVNQNMSEAFKKLNTR